MLRVQRLKSLKSFELDGLRCVIGQLSGRSTGALGVHERETGIKLDLFDEIHCFFKIFFRFVRESDNEVRCNADVRTNRTKLANDGLVLKDRITAFHAGQDAVAPGLNRQVDVVGQNRDLAISLDQTICKFFRVRRCVADSLNAVDFCHIFKQQGKVDDFAVRTFSAISVNVLSQQSDFLYALSSKLRDFNEDVFDGTRELFTACIRHDTVGAVLAAAFHNGNECCSCIGMRSRQTVKFFDFRETDIDLRTMLFFVLFQEFRKTMEGLRSEDHVDVGSTANDVAAFLAGDTAAHSNLKIRLCLFQFSDSSEVGKYFFLSLFSNRACIKNN